MNYYFVLDLVIQIWHVNEMIWRWWKMMMKKSKEKKNRWKNTNKIYLLFGDNDISLNENITQHTHLTK